MNRVKKILTSKCFVMAKLREKNLCFYKQLGVQKILLNARKDILSEFYSSVLGKLDEYDRNNRTDYCFVLREYLSCGGSIQEVAVTTGVHRNTINYKMKQIKEILGTDMNAEEKMNLMLAYNISDIINGVS